MTQQRLSGTIVVIIIAIGVQACIIVFIFVKRQVQRFALRNRRGPHTSVGHGAPKALRRETDRLLEYVSYIRHEPPLLVDKTADPEVFKRDFRKQIVVNFQAFEGELADYSHNYIRPAGGNVRSHLLNCVYVHGPLAGADTKLIQQVCDDYDAARHHYEPIDRHKCKVFIERLDRLRMVVRANKLVRPVQPSPGQLSDPRRRRQIKPTAVQPSDPANLGTEDVSLLRSSNAVAAVSSIVSVENQTSTSPQPNAV